MPTQHALPIGELVGAGDGSPAWSLAKATVTLDHLTAGRVEVALGVGDPLIAGGDRLVGVTCFVT